MKAEQILRFRLGRHGLDERRVLSPAEAAGCPASAFSRDSALLALAARSEKLTRDDYVGAVDSGAVVLAPTLRAAIHAQAPEDFSLVGRALIASDDDELAAQIGNQFKRIVKETGIGANEALDEVAEATTNALPDGRKLTKDELHVELRKRVREDLQPWCKGCGSNHVAPMLWRFAGVRAGARRDSQGRYLIGRPKPKGKPDPAEAVRLFLYFHGPAGPGHFATWSGVPSKSARRIWDEVEPELEKIEWSGGEGWLPAEDVDELNSAPAVEGLRLLPPNDPYLSQPDRTTLVPDEGLRKRIFRPIASPGVVLVDGRIAGIWKVRAHGKRASFEIEELTRVPKLGLGAEAERVAALRGSSGPELTWS